MKRARPPRRAPSRSSALDDLDNLLAITAHELQSPIVAAQMALQAAMALGDRPSDKDRLISRALMQTIDLGSLIDGILDVSLLRGGALTLRREPIELASIVETAVARTISHRNADPASVSVRIEDRGWGSWDRIRMGQLVTNLVGNALKYGGPGDVEVALERRASRRLGLMVSDGGPGIPEDDQERVFGLFARGSNPRAGGAGIGLFVVREVARAHDGVVSIGRAGATGTVVQVEVPVIEATTAARHLR
jgi:signal transduction histidine kinase